MPSDFEALDKIQFELHIVAYLLKARTVKPAERAVIE
jgi:hypothetical protein